jgi:hypothetical protein
MEGRYTYKAGAAGILRLEEGHRADVAIYDLKTLQPYPALTIRLQ